MTFAPAVAVPIEALGIRSDAAPWLGDTVAARQRAEASRAGLLVAHSDDVITPTAGAVVSSDLLRRFRAASDGIQGDVVGVVAGPMASWAAHPAFGPPARVLRFRGGLPRDAEAWAVREREAPRVEVEGVVREVDVPVADTPGGRVVQVPLSDAYLCATHHWSGLLWANLLGLGPHLWQQVVGPPWRAPVRLAWAWMRARSTDPFVIASRLNRIERGARIHPSAVVEGSVVGAGSEIGPGAVVRGAVLGAGCRVEPQALVVFSVLAAGAVVQRRGWVQLSVLAEGVGAAGSMQLSVLGPNVLFKHGSYLMDVDVHKAVRVARGGTLHEAPLGMAGSGVGAGSVIGSGLWVAPGRSVPPNSVLARDPDDVARPGSIA